MAGTGAEAPLQQTAGAVLAESAREDSTGPKTFDSLRVDHSVFEQTEEEKALEEKVTSEEEETEDDLPSETPEEETPGVEPGTKTEKPETPPEEKPTDEEPEKPTDTQTEDGYVAEVQLVVDGKPATIPIEKLYDTVEMDLFTPEGGTTTVKGLEPLRVLAQKGLYSDERNRKANQMMEEAKTISTKANQEIVSKAQTLANSYLKDWMERNLTGSEQDPNNPLSQIPQGQQAPTSLRDQYLTAQLADLRKQITDQNNQREQERKNFEEQGQQQARLKAGNNIAQTVIMPFQKHFKALDGSLDVAAFESFADVAANRTVFRVQQINAERSAEDPQYPGMSEAEVSTITRQVAQEVYKQDQDRIQRLVQTQIKGLKKNAKVGALRGGGAPIEAPEKPKAAKGPKTFESLRQQRPA